MPGLFQLRPPPAFRQPGNAEEYFASYNRARYDAISGIQPYHPVLDSWVGSHQVTDRVGVEQVCHSVGYLLNTSWSRTGKREAAMAESSSSTAAGRG